MRVCVCDKQSNVRLCVHIQVIINARYRILMLEVTMPNEKTQMMEERVVGNVNVWKTMEERRRMQEMPLMSKPPLQFAFSCKLKINR